MPLRSWEPLWRWLALYEAIVILLILHGIVQDWLVPPERWEWTETFWGQNTEFAEHRRLCGGDWSGCPRHPPVPLMTGQPPQQD